MKKSEKVEKKEKGSPQPGPISVRPAPDSDIHKILKEIQDINPHVSKHSVINECLERFLPTMLKEEVEDLRKRLAKYTEEKKS